MSIDRERHTCFARIIIIQPSELNREKKMILIISQSGGN